MACSTFKDIKNKWKNSKEKREKSKEMLENNIVLKIVATIIELIIIKIYI